MFKSGIITILGRPNQGKSTLINTLVGEKVAIVSWRPQTTRDKIVGIMNGEDYQAVFIDTPGIHNAKNDLSHYMMKNVESAEDGVDIVIYVVSVDKKMDATDEAYIAKYAKKNIPFIVVINKCDTVKPEQILKRIEYFSTRMEGITAVIPVSALTGKNVDLLKEEIVKHLPEGEMLYPEDMFTDKNLRFMVGEIVREKAMRFLGDEVPYGIGVAIDRFDERDDGVVEIDATIICDKKAHKPIIIGNKGEMIKRISTTARLDMEELLGTKVFLNVWVKVKEEWRDSSSALRELGYDVKDI